MTHKFVDGKIDDILNKDTLLKNGVTLVQYNDRIKVFYQDSEPEIVFKYVKSWKAGCGKPGSLDWHKAEIEQMQSAPDIAEYINKTIGVKITVGRIDFTKKRALKALEAHYDNS